MSDEYAMIFIALVFLANVALAWCIYAVDCLVLKLSEQANRPDFGARNSDALRKLTLLVLKLQQENIESRNETRDALRKLTPLILKAQRDSASTRDETRKVQEEIAAMRGDSHEILEEITEIGDEVHEIQESMAATGEVAREIKGKIDSLAEEAQNTQTELDSLQGRLGTLVSDVAMVKMELISQGSERVAANNNNRSDSRWVNYLTPAERSVWNYATP